MTGFSFHKKESKALKRWRESDRMDRWAILVGILGAILIHLLIILSAPYIERHVDPGETFTSSEANKDTPFDVELADDEFEPPPKFVEANPDVPDNVPDETDQVAAQNQQVAQEEPTPDGESETPASKGDPDKEGNALVSGDLAPQLPPTSPSPPTPDEQPQEEQAQEALPPRVATSPAPGEEEITGESEDGIGSNIVKIPEDEVQRGDEVVEGEKDATRMEGPATMPYFRVDAKNPLPRQFLPPTRRARPSPILNNEFGTKNIGAVAYDAKWSGYGEYMQKLIDTVQMQWERLLDQSRVYPTFGSYVRVVFKLNAEGDIVEIVSVSGTAPKFFQDTCVSAIVDRAPYEKWTSDMLRTLGDIQELTFTFYFQ